MKKSHMLLCLSYKILKIQYSYIANMLRIQMTMKNLLAILGLVISNSLIASTGMTDDVNISIQGLKKSEGQIVLLVYNKENENSFLSLKEDYLCKAIIKVVDIYVPTIAVCPQFGSSEIAVFVFHDLNANGTVDYNIFGVPKEPLGFSGGCKPRFGPPNFSDCSIRWEPERLSLEINMP